MGEVVVENAPHSVKEFAIRTFGENDKDALIAGTTIILVVISIGLGVAAIRRLWIGVAGTLVLGAVGTWGGPHPPGSRSVRRVAAVLGSLVGVLVMVWLIRGSLGRPVPRLRHRGVPLPHRPASIAVGSS